jgi:hypothetical protein
VKVLPTPRPRVVASEDDYEQGRRDERAAIVAWLRQLLPASPQASIGTTWSIADAIERGHHERGEHEEPSRG